MKKSSNMPEVICIGMSCIDVMIPGLDLTNPQDMELHPVNQISFSVGGDAANQSIVISRLGLKTRLLTGIGEDSVGEFMLNYIKKDGVDVSEVYVNKEKSTAVTVVGIAEDGKRRFIIVDFSMSANNFIPDLSNAKGAKVISIGSLLMPPFLDPVLTAQVLEEAKATGAIVCADVVFSEQYPMTLDDYGASLSNIDYIFPNDEEAKCLTGKNDMDEIADVFLSYGIKNVVIKAGKQGCYFKNRKEHFWVGSYHVNAVDTTGAGDNFVSGFITFLLEGKSHLECCKFAHATAGIAVSAVGANTGVKSREQVDAFFREQLKEERGGI